MCVYYYEFTISRNGIDRSSQFFCIVDHLGLIEPFDAHCCHMKHPVPDPG